ncbi:uncharacterized protein LOC120005624 isoform X2 [Tripterygium wilfordii]|uniref:uncharacterized protein LOC120005624 isoform X2 n=1 Tax=Tripterygium wilfordii TaxID=458696 RepID=UPI0018F80688|nr:uncharacterized protein LOC120005624 isoform X2 [Tripterygium wilfordii]
MEIAVKTFFPGLNSKMIMIPTASPVRHFQHSNLISSSWSCCHGHASHFPQSNNKSLILCGTQQNLFSSAVSTNIHWRVSKCAYQPVCASGLGLEASIIDPEDKAALNLKDAKIVVVSQYENELELRVDLNGDETQKSFDKILRELASTAPPIAGFRRQKGGKTTQTDSSICSTDDKEKKIMEIAVKTFPGLNSKIISSRQRVDVCIPKFSCKRVSFSAQVGHITGGVWRRRECCRFSHALCAVLAEEVEVSSSQFEDFSITSTSINEGKELKISLNVFGAKTRVIFDNIFDKMVAAAQPIPGFRRVKGGKTPNIPRDILLEILGPSRVYKEVIKKIINTTIAEYVEKGGLKVSKNLRVEQSFEDLEDNFEPGEDFSFDAVVQLHETK